jgi:hypothetical protein
VQKVKESDAIAETEMQKKSRAEGGDEVVEERKINRKKIKIRLSI